MLSPKMLCAEMDYSVSLEAEGEALLSKYGVSINHTMHQSMEAALCPTGYEESDDEVLLAETPAALDHVGGNSEQTSEPEIPLLEVLDEWKSPNKCKPTTHVVYTHISKYPTRETCKMTKTTRARCKHRPEMLRDG